MKVEKLPFTIYDIVRYFLPGAVLLASIRLILGFGVLVEEPRGATIGPMSDSR